MIGHLTPSLSLLAVIFFLNTSNVSSWINSRGSVESNVRSYSTSSPISDGSLVRTEKLGRRYKTWLPDWLLDRCNDLGFVHPTRIQIEALDAILGIGEENDVNGGNGCGSATATLSDVVVQAETGSGKTLCYLLPALASVDPERATVQAIIVVPTRELGLQVATQAKRLAAACPVGSSKRLYVMSVLQGSQNRRQRAWAWAEPPQIVIGTPAELLQMVQHGGIKRYSNIKMVVVDEVDACLLNNAGSLQLASTPLHDLLSKHLSQTFLEKQKDEFALSAAAVSYPTKQRKVKGRQTILCSATIPQHRHFIQQCVSNKWTTKTPILVSLQTGELLLPPTLKHEYMAVSKPTQKFAALKRFFLKLVEKSQHEEISVCKVLVFCEPQRPLEEMAQALALKVPNDRGVFWQENTNLNEEATDFLAITAVLRYQDSLSQRAAAMDAFVGTKDNQDASVRVLLSTDLAARGLDVPSVTHVVHFDLPPDADTYVHRAGRTGRLGRKGKVLSIVAIEQEFVLERLANKLMLQLHCTARQKVRDG